MTCTRPISIKHFSTLVSDLCCKFRKVKGRDKGIIEVNIVEGFVCDGIVEGLGSDGISRDVSK